MLSEATKAAFGKLALGLPPVAIKFLPVRPEGIPRSEKTLAFCQFLKEAQVTGKTFYVSKENDACYGKMALGMIPKPPVTASGQAGFDFGVYRTASACMRLYQHLPVLVPGAVNYVVFSRVEDCDFDPDLIIAVAEAPQAEILMRATSYISGDLWESVSSPVISCAWVYAHPVITGKVNHVTTGFYHGLRRRNIYEPGLRIISIPFGKIEEVSKALQEMDWVPIAFRGDEESKAELKRRMDNWQDMAREMDCTCDLH